MHQYVAMSQRVPVVSDGGQASKVDLLVLLEVQSSGWALRHGNDPLLSAGVDVHNSHGGLKKHTHRHTKSKHMNRDCHFFFLLVKTFQERKINVESNVVHSGPINSILFFSCFNKNESIKSKLLKKSFCNSTLFLVPRHSEGLPASVVVPAGWHGAAHPWSQIKIHLHLALGELQGHEVLLRRGAQERLGVKLWHFEPNKPPQKKGFGFRWPAAHQPCLPWLNTWAGLQRRRCGTWRPRWRRWGSTWWVAPPLRSPRRPGGPSLRRWIAAGWRANRKIHFQVLWLTALKSDG